MHIKIYIYMESLERVGNVIMTIYNFPIKWRNIGIVQQLNTLF